MISMQKQIENCKLYVSEWTEDIKGGFSSIK